MGGLKIFFDVSQLTGWFEGREERKGYLRTMN